MRYFRQCRTLFWVILFVPFQMAWAAPLQPATPPAMQPATQKIMQTAMAEAQRLLEIIRSSALDGAWRGNALARAGRALAAYGNEEAARVMARDAVTAVNEPAKTPPPAALAIGGSYTAIMQIFIRLGDRDTAMGLAREARPSLDAIEEAPAKAALEAYLALALIEADDLPGARAATLQALRAAVTTTKPKDQVVSLALVAIAQGRLQDQEQAASTVAALRAALGALSADDPERVAGLAWTARALAATGDLPAARELALQADTLYARALVGNQPPIPGQRAVTLCLIAVALREAGDKSAALRVLRSAQIAAQTISETYDRYLAMITVVDTVFQVTA